MHTIRLELRGDVGGLMPGISALAADAGIVIGGGGVRVAVSRDPAAGVTVTRDASGAAIRYAETIHFFRGLGLLVEALRAGENLSVHETPQFVTNGVMIDMSQGNAVLRQVAVERVIRRMALMGLNMIMLYAEDSYTVPGQPEFGYMRGRYTHEEMQAMDAYAAQLGVELIPCMQTLAHLIDVLKWETFHPWRDDDDTLLVGDPRSYEFIEKMIDAAAAPVRTKRIHIGMDEAWKLGLGRYLAQNGYTPKFDIMNRHLAKVLEITERKGLQPMIWSDMYFRAASKTGDYYDREAVIPDAVIRQAPKGATLVYWDYYHGEQSFYEDFIERHRRFGHDPIFAGGIWNWFSFGVNQSWTATATNAALTACKVKGIREVFATIWGDDANECVIDSTFWGMQLFAEHGYARVVDTTRLPRRFQTCTGARQDDFMATQLIDEVPGVPAGNPGMCNPSRYLLWQDPLLGLFDANTRGLGIGAHYGTLAPRLAEAAKRGGDSGPALDILAHLASALELKAELGIRMADAYASNDRGALKRLRDRTIPETLRRVRRLRDLHRDVWLGMYKPAGWEIFEIRYGGVMARLETAAARLDGFLKGRISRIEELEEPRMLYNGKKGPVRMDSYARMASASRLSCTL